MYFRIPYSGLDGASILPVEELDRQKQRISYPTLIYKLRGTELAKPHFKAIPMELTTSSLQRNKNATFKQG